MEGIITPVNRHRTAAIISRLGNIFRRKKKEEPAPDPIEKELRKAEIKYGFRFKALDRYNFGVVKLGQDNDTAVKAFTEAIEIDPKCGYFYKERAKAYRELGKTELALADIRKAKGLRPKKNL